MRICFIAPASNYHTQKWSKWFEKNGHEVHIISFINTSEIHNVKVHFLDAGVDVQGRDIEKLKYLLFARKIKKLVKKINPDVVNVHYATSYGTVAAFSGIKNYILSVWGTDIYAFPRKSIMHKLMLKYSLKRAKYIFSTSKAMAEETKKYTKKKIEITPFGVDMNLFHPEKRERKDDDNTFVIGTVKALESVYGIELILRAVAEIKISHPEYNIKIRIAGKGSKENELKCLSEKLKISNDTTWLGFISQEQAAYEWANMDLAVIPSYQESFGVSAVEAQACGTPVLITEVQGLMEATLPEVSSRIVPIGDVNSLKEEIIFLYKNRAYGRQLGYAGRKFVENNFDIDICFKKIESLFYEQLSKI